MGGVVTVAVYAVLAVVVVAALVALAVLVLPGTEELAPAPADRTPWALPAERAMTGPDVGRLRLPVTLRGYRFAETDAVLDRLGEEIAYRDSMIATLQAELDGRAYSGVDTLAPGGPESSRGLPVDEAGGDRAADDDVVVQPEPGDEELVELGETPEEAEHEALPAAEAQPEVEPEPALGGDVVGIDEQLPGDDDLSPAPVNDLPDGDPAADEGPDGPPDDPPATRT